MSEESTRKWLEKTIREEDVVYVIVGFTTLRDAKVIEYAGTDHGVEGNVTTPISAVLMANGILVPFLGEVVDSSLGSKHGSSKGEAHKFIAKGDQVCGIRYCKLKHKKFSSKSVDMAELGAGKRIMFDQKGGANNDAIEVELEEEDIALGDDMEEHTFWSGETFVVLNETDD